MNRRIEIEGNKKNLSRAFILPMVGINYKTLPNNFINSYITTNDEIIIVFDKTYEYNEIFYRFFEHCKSNIKNYKNYEEESDEIALMFDIPQVFKEEFEIFLLGKYSKFSEDYKRIICNFFGSKSIKDLRTVTEYNVIYPEDFKRKQIANWLSVDKSIVDWKSIVEVIDKPDLSREMYKPINILLAQQLQIEEGKKR